MAKFTFSIISSKPLFKDATVFEGTRQARKLRDTSFRANLPSV